MATKKGSKKGSDEKLTESIDSMTDAIDVKTDLTEAKANRFYDRTRRLIGDYVERRGPKLGKTKEYLLFVPDVFILMFRLFRDDRVAVQDKAILGTGLAYFIFPLDVMPEAFMGPLGYLDDLVFAAYILNRMLLHTDEEILREHWSGKDDVLVMIRQVLKVGDSLVNKNFVKRIKKFIG